MRMHSHCGEDVLVTFGNLDGQAIVFNRSDRAHRDYLAHAGGDGIVRVLLVESLPQAGEPFHAASPRRTLLHGLKGPIHLRPILGGRGTGLKQTLQAFERARIYVGLTGVGIARAALEDATSYAKQRVQHGKPIAGHQMIQAYIAEMATELDAGRLLCLRAMSMLQEGVRCDTEYAITP